jgi:homoprotocatechuate degradation regulator HpaR
MPKNTDKNLSTGPLFVPTSRSLSIALLRARETVMVPVRQMLLKSGMSEQQWRVLKIVADNAGLEQTAIARAACLQLASLTRILQSMEKDKLIERVADDVDRRKALVNITPTGMEMITSYRQLNSEIFTKLKREYGEGKLELLLDLLEDFQKLKL